jgi:hypothetical protein
VLGSFQVTIPVRTKEVMQNTERERWDGEEVYRRNGLAMVSEERSR